MYAFFSGLVFDTAVAVYSFLPFFLVLLIFPLTRRLAGWLIAIDIFVFSFNLVAEYFFYDEFTDRFNFIAIDYLVYTNEVVANIWQSYPIVPIVAAMVVVAAAAGYVWSGLFFRVGNLSREKWWEGWRSVTVYATSFALLLVVLNESAYFSRANGFEEMAGKNGMHALFAAYRNNEIKFDRFYTTTDTSVAVRNVHKALDGGPALDLKVRRVDPDTIVRNIREETPMNKLNVIVILMESLSARFMNSYDGSQNLTPNLDRLASEGLFFNRIYATGTRTVRGLEAVVLSIPPTPGQSIVRRPAGLGLFNFGTPFRENGYKTSFIYGGRAIFDNMGAFFEGNRFQVFDQSSFPAEEISFANAWGVADEDLYRQVIKISDSFYSGGEKFFHIVLNTSNHRPYTYPSDRVKIPSGSGRDGAVQYTDFAIGKFLEEARLKPWFDDTLFVFIADHNAAVAGQRNINPNDYLIPMIFYSPKWVKPEVNRRLGSQIDLAPTLLEYLSASYQSRFFGMELQEEDPGRAFLGTYQNVGYLTEDSLTVLGPNRKVEEFSWDGRSTRLLSTKTFSVLPNDADKNLTATVSFYKAASDYFSRNLLDEKRRIASDINARN